MGNNVCLCPSGFYGDSCQITSKFSDSCIKVFPSINSMSFYVILSKSVECPSVRPSVSASFPDSNLSSF